MFSIEKNRLIKFFIPTFIIGVAVLYQLALNPLSAADPQTVKRWTRLLGTTEAEYSQAAATDNSGNIYIAGYTYGGLDGNADGWGLDMVLVKYNPDGVKQWTKQLGTGGHDLANGVTTDNSGNIYVTGYTDGAMPGNAASGINDYFLAKYNSSGVQQWVKQAGTVSDDLAYGVATDSSGNAYVTGMTGGALDGQANAGIGDIFLIKYNSSGVRQWTKLLGNGVTNWAYGINIDNSDNIFLTGYTGGSLDGNPSAGGKDIFLAKYNTSGTKQWTKQLGSAVDEEAKGVSTDNSGNIFVTGNTAGNMDGANAGLNDMFLAKYNSSGVKQWTKQTGTTAEDFSNGVSTDSQGNVFITGQTKGSLHGNANSGFDDITLLKFDTSGVRQWTKQLGTAGGDISNGITADSKDNIFITGYTSGYLDGYVPAGNWDMFLAEFSTIDLMPPAYASFMAPLFSTSKSSTNNFAVSWKATDNVGGWGIGGYQVQYRVNANNVWKTLPFNGEHWTSKKTVIFELGKPGNTYQFRVCAKDKAENISGWSSIKHSVIPYDDDALSYSSSDWKTAAMAGAFGGDVRHTKIKGEFATLDFTGKSVSLIAPKGSNRGKLDVFIRNKKNGVWSAYEKIKTLDLYSASLKNRVKMLIKSWTTSSTHQVKFVSSGTKNDNSSGKRVDIDGVAILK